MAYPGGKDGAGVAQRLINQIPPHDVFVSLCLGDCAVLRRKRPARRNIGIDLDAGVLRRWIERPVLKESGLELYQCNAVEWLRHTCGWYRVADPCDCGRPAALVADPCGGGHTAAVADCGDGSSPAADPCDRGRPAALVADPCGGRSTTLAGWFLFADPPYVLESRRSPRPIYAHEPDAAWHRNLVATLVFAAAAGADVMVTHYPHRLYGEGLDGWRTWTYQSMTRGGSLATEQVWCSYPPPERLHDPSYLGRDKREREAIHRVVRNLTAKLGRLPPLRRQAVLDSLAASYGPSPAAAAVAEIRDGTRFADAATDFAVRSARPLQCR